MSGDRSSSFIADPTPLRRVAVVHDWLTGMRGGEQVLEAILQLFPEAEIFTLFHFRGSVSPLIESRPIHVSWLQPVASRIGDYRTLLPLFPGAVRGWNLGSFELVISSSHCVAKGVDPGNLPHVCYCHTPMRYVWDRFDDYFPRSRPVARAVMKMLSPRLRRWDVATARGVTSFVANSSFVRERIANYYGREAEVIHPFVDADFLAAPLHHEREDYDVVVSALVPYKHVSLAVEAAVASGRRLIVLGGGPLLVALQERRHPNVEIAGHVSRARIIECLSRARSLVLPGIEDFGITPLEAMALGTPVVALRGGGVLDSVKEGATGIFFDHPSVEALRCAIDEVGRRQWNREAIRAHAASFTREHFQKRFMSVISQVAGTQ